MKKIFLILSLCSLILWGCLSTIPENDEVIDNYNKLSNGEKTLSKAFYAYDLIGEDCWEYRGNFRLYDWGAEFSSCHDCFGLGTDFVARFVFLQPYLLYKHANVSDRFIQHARYVQAFDKNNGLTEKERYCLQLLVANGMGRFVFKNNEDECIIMRRALLKNDALVNCLFDYKDYIPHNAKIGSFDNFKKLKEAFEDSVSKCEIQKANHQFTTSEYEICLNNAVLKSEQIATSGVLQ